MEGFEKTKSRLANPVNEENCRPSGIDAIVPIIYLAAVYFGSCFVHVCNLISLVKVHISLLYLFHQGPLWPKALVPKITMKVC